MENFLDAAIEIAQDAGRILMWHRGVSFELKGEYDLVTAADRASERFIVEQLRKRFPNHGIVAEEGGRAEMRGEFHWYVDPLDGTTNFAHGFPMWNVTLALARKEEIVAGVIYDPLNRELFAAERGAGARLNGAPIRTSQTRKLDDALLATGFPSRKR
ncbi:MAG: inositol monophosphatase family protein, partial [Bryobacteraceae bacterium]